MSTEAADPFCGKAIQGRALVTWPLEQAPFFKIGRPLRVSVKATDLAQGDRGLKAVAPIVAIAGAQPLLAIALSA